MKLQILIPQYNETEQIIKPLLDSISIQQRVSFDDFDVIICNDGSDVLLSDEFLAGYPYHITYHKEPHRGISGTRNALIDYATADYIMFCDADDMFFNSYGVLFILREINNNPFDMYYSCFTEESYDGEEYQFVTHENDDSQFIHGKVFRRQFLIDEKIRFNENISVHEDGCFCTIAKHSTSSRQYCPTPFYMWRWRNDSTCRKNPEYLLDTTTMIIDGNDSIIERLIRKGDDYTVRSFVASFIINEYYDLNKPEWRDPKNIHYLHKTEVRMGQYYRKYKPVWDSVAREDIVSISDVFRQKNIQEGMDIENMSLPEWLKHIEQL